MRKTPHAPGTRQSCLALLILLAPLSFHFAFAQEPERPSAPPENLDPAPEKEAADADLFALSLEELLNLEVTVEVASRFNESDLQAGSTVNLITRKDWERRGARNLEDAAGHLPGTIFLPNLFGGEQLTIRGFAGRQLNGVSVLLDDVPINSLDAGTPLFEINSLRLNVLDRIEMVRGPGSAVYGGDAFQGVLGLHTYAADEDAMEAETEAGTDDFYTSALRLSQSLHDGVRLHAALGYTHQGDEDIRYRYTDPDTGVPGTGTWANKIKALMGVAKIETDPERPLSARIGFYYNESETHDFPGLGTFNFNGRSNLRDRDFSHDDARFQMINGAMVQQLPHDIVLEVNGFYWETQRLRSFQSTPVILVGAENDANRAGGNVLLKQPRNAWRTQWLLGAGYDEAEVDKHTVTRTVSGQPRPTTIGGQQGVNRESFNGLAQARTSVIDDTVHLLYGGRIDDYSDFGTEFSPRAGVIYNPVPDTALKFLYGNAFRPPTAAQTTGTPAVPGNPDLQPETIDTYELVAMRQTENWKAQATLFHSDWQDAIITGAERRENLGENEANGVELSGSIIQGNARLDLSGSYVESKDKVNNIDYGAFPRVILNPGFGISFPACNLEFYLINRIHLDADEGPTSAADPNPDALKDYWRTDLSITWLHPRHDLEVFVNLLNLFDRDNLYPALNNTEHGLGDIGFSPSVGLRTRW